MKADLPTLDQDCVITNERLLNYSREAIFSAWSNPEMLKKWWGPKGFTNTFEEFDFRPGGTWKFVMHGPDKGNYQNECEFLVIEKPELIYWKRRSKPMFEVLITLHEVGKAKTKLVFQMIFPSSDECNKMKNYVVDKNEENFDRLESELSML